jgi:hypothetical protein
MRSIVTPFLDIEMLKKHTEMEEGSRNWNSDDRRTEGLARRMKLGRLLEERWKGQIKQRQIKLYSKVER